MKVILGLVLSFFTFAVFLPATDRPNVLFVAIDDLNDWVGVFEGNPQVKTPNLDKFNQRGGLVMYDAHTPSTVCGPSQGSRLWGLRPWVSGPLPRV